MTVTTRVFTASKFLENVQTTQYTATNVTGLLDKCIVTNVTAAAVTFSANIVTGGGSATSSNIFINTKSIQPGETYSCPELVGAVLNNGDFVSTIASAASSLSFRMSGREIS